MSLSKETADLLAAIRLGEDGALELKAVHFSGAEIDGPMPRDVADEIVSLANSRGGVLLLGVDDKAREVTGIPLDRLDKVELWLANLLQDLIDPPPLVDVRRLELPDRAGELKPVIRVHVPQSLFVHTGPKGYLHRIGSTKRKLSTEQLARLMQRRNRSGLVWFDESPVHNCRFEDLSEPHWRRFLGGGVDPERIKLAKMKILTRQDDEEFASVAGCLMCTAQPTQWLRTAYVQCVRYLGTERTADQQHDALDCEGPADEQIINATRFVQRNMHTGARKLVGREDFPQYHMGAVFEAIANAVAHRDYSQPGSRIRVHQFADRLEIFTPGPLANSQTVETLAYKQATRNELLVSLLSRCPVDIPGVERRTVMDKRGEGVPLLLTQSERISGRLPTYELIDDTELKLTIYAAETPRGVRESPFPYE